MRNAFTHILVASFLLPLGASADMVTVFPSKDNTLFEDAAGALSDGAGQYLFVGRTLEPTNRRALLAFDLTGIPAGAHVESASLTLHMSRTIVGSVDISAHRIQSDWGQGLSNAASQEGLGAPAQTDDATWLHNFFGTSTWTTPGGDFDSIASATTPVDGVGFYTWSAGGLARDVHEWILQPETNFGWLLRGSEFEGPTAKRFDSRENPNVSFRPTLAITFAAVPEPATGVALLVVLAIVRRRRSRTTPS